MYDSVIYIHKYVTASANLGIKLLFMKTEVTNNDPAKDPEEHTGLFLRKLAYTGIKLISG